MKIYIKNIDYEQDDLGLQIQNLYAVAQLHEIGNYSGLPTSTINGYICRTANPEAVVEVGRKWYADNKEHSKQVRHEWYINNKEHRISIQIIWNNNNRESISTWQNKWHADKRQKAFQLISNKEKPSCKCCNVTVALTLDHLKQNGAQERLKSNGKIRRSNYNIINNILDGTLPKADYQILCSMCNQAIYNNYGVCPHIKSDRSSKNKQLHDKAIVILDNKCFNCEEDNPAFLQIEHINGNGHEDRKKYGGSTGFYRAIVNGKRSTDDLRIACGNCNHILYYKPKELERAEC